MKMKRLLHQQTGMFDFFYPEIFMVIQCLLPIFTLHDYYTL